MEPADNPYSPPDATLLSPAEAPVPAGWSSGQLRVLAGLSAAAALGSLPLMLLWLIGLKGHQALMPHLAWLNPLTALLGAYLLLRLKAFLGARFGVATLGLATWSVIAMEGVIQLFWADPQLGLPGDWQVLAYLAAVSLHGLGLAWLGVRLVRTRKVYAVLRLFGWLLLLGGLLRSSVALASLASLPLLGAQLALVAVLLRGASELRARGR